jgi:hypothetical protein
VVVGTAVSPYFTSPEGGRQELEYKWGYANKTTEKLIFGAFSDVGTDQLCPNSAIYILTRKFTHMASHHFLYPPHFLFIILYTSVCLHYVPNTSMRCIFTVIFHSMDVKCVQLVKFKDNRFLRCCAVKFTDVSEVRATSIVGAMTSCRDGGGSKHL